MPHLDDAYALARWLTGSRIDAEDVVQTACLRAFRGIGNFANGNARAWMLTIVRHAGYEWLRKNRPTSLLFIENLDDVKEATPREVDVETPETVLIAKDSVTMLGMAVAELPPPIRETLRLRCVQGLAYREIAEATGVPIGTVMSRLARGRDKLVVLIAKDEERRRPRLSSPQKKRMRLSGPAPDRPAEECPVTAEFQSPSDAPGSSELDNRI